MSRNNILVDLSITILNEILDSDEQKLRTVSDFLCGDKVLENGSFTILQPKKNYDAIFKNKKSEIDNLEQCNFTFMFINLLR